MASGDFNFGEFGSPYTSPTTTSFPDHLSGLQPVQPVSQQGYNGSTVHPHQSGHLGPLVPLATEAKGKAEPSPKNLVVSEEQTRRLAEEDKRRRNTAASARFRIKKKQREQALEKSAKEMMDKVNRLESHISSLETENTWLRRIVMDKYGRDKLPLLLRELRKDSTVEKEDESKNKDASPSSKIGDEGSEMGEDDDEAAEK